MAATPTSWPGQARRPKTLIIEIIGRGDSIRNCDPLLPKQVLYQAELRPDIPMLCRVAAARSSSVASGEGFLADLLRCGLLIGAKQLVADLVAGRYAEPRGSSSSNFQHPANEPL
jgi:hypothetical protein